MEMILKRGNDQRRYNEPRHEVAAIFVEDEGAPNLKEKSLFTQRMRQLKQYHTCQQTVILYVVIPTNFPLGYFRWLQGMQYNLDYSKRHAITLL